MSNNFFFKSFPLLENLGKPDRARQYKDDNVTWRMHFACWVTKTTDAYSGYVILIAFPR